MSLLLKKNHRYTYSDYLSWSDEERWELIDGKAYSMSPAPSFKHQNITGNFYHILKNKLKGKSCIPGIAPTDIVLSEHDVVQPDVFVVCDRKKITEANIQGAPDLIIEVLSPSTALKDKREKKRLYEKYGVSEYIIIDPIDYYVERFFLGKKRTYNKGEVFGKNETMHMLSLKDIEIPLAEVFEMENK